MSQPPGTELIKTVLRQALPNVNIEAIRPLPCSRLQRAYRVEVSDGRTLMLTHSPPPTLRLLRSEQWPVVSNFLVVKWLLTTVFESPAADEGASLDEAAAANRFGGRSGEGKQHARIKPADSLREIVLPYIPSHIASSASTTDSGSAFHLFEPAKGVPIASLPRHLTVPERKIVDYQVGRLLRRLSELKSPNGTFGPAVAVIGSRQQKPSQHYDTPPQASAVGAGGTGSWTNAFHSLLESILRDGEDMAVTISYAAIRSHFRRLSHLLDAVTISRLVVLDAGEDENVLVTGAVTEEDTEQQKRQGRRHISSSPIGPSAASGNAGFRSPQTETVTEFTPTLQGPSGVTVTGLWDWSNTVFGDPLFATVFSRETSAEFLRGFRQAPHHRRHHHQQPHQQQQRTNKEKDYTRSGGKKSLRKDTETDQAEDEEDAEIQSEGEEEEWEEGEEEEERDRYNDDAIIEDRANAPIRLLLYECYHATVCVVRQFYRPDGAGSSARELAARRRLAAVLARLRDVEDAATAAAEGKRPRRASASAGSGSGSGDACAWPDGWPPGKKAKVSSAASAKQQR
ncbi:hypothetical protein SLS62_011089 [Diatrype stigma]|uniref:Uncharacterized protein n=1 Tax=Diatrype stigma TaxID=117547 RepID=A0AAN9YG61_9PEZI